MVVIIKDRGEGFRIPLGAPPASTRRLGWVPLSASGSSAPPSPENRMTQKFSVGFDALRRITSRQVRRALIQRIP